MTTAREQILDTTCELLEMQGYHATGLNQIIKESGSPKGSLYYYFPGGKDELTVEALQRTGALVLERITSSLMEIEEPAEAVRAFILRLAYFVPESGYRAGGPITTVALETATTNERLSAECRRIYDSWRAAFVAKLVTGGYSQERAVRLAALIIAAIEGAIILSRTERSPEPLRSAAEEIAILLHCSVQ